MKKLYTLALCFALLVLAACSDNLFGDSSSGNSDCGRDIKCLRLDAENAFRNNDGKGAYRACSTIVYLDSTASYGYFGMAKATLLKYKINPLSIFNLAVPDPDTKACPFVGGEMEDRDRYYRAMLKIDTVLKALNVRDSLTDFYECYNCFFKNGNCDDKRFNSCKKRHVKEEGDSSSILRKMFKSFEQYYCPKAKCIDPISKDEFPLSDREYKSSYFGITLVLSSISVRFLKFFDTYPYPDGDGTITNKDLPVKLECTENPITGEIEVTPKIDDMLKDLEDRLEDHYNKVAACEKAKDPDKCYKEAAEEVPDDIKILNGKVDDFKGSFDEVIDILDGLGYGKTTDDDGNEIDIKEKLDEYKDFVSFYKIGTHIDLDGDGCIDEELLDGMDNDGDGLINENSRLAPTGPDKELFGVSPMNNSMVGEESGIAFSKYRTDDNWKFNKPITLDPSKACIYNNRDRLYCTPLEPDSITGKVTVLNFTQMNYPKNDYSDGKEYWIKNDRNLKLKVAQDRDCTSPEFGGNNYEKQFKYRIENIGGCWPFYDFETFKKYCQGKL